jgi:hypothetical protein
LGQSHLLVAQFLEAQMTPMLEHVTGRYVHRINPMLVSRVIAYKRRNAGDVRLADHRDAKR